MFNKKLKRSIKEMGKEITAMRVVNATIQTLYSSFESKTERTAERFERFEDRVQKLEENNKGLTSRVKNIGEELVEARDVLKEFIKVSGYDVSVDRNRDYMKAYKVNITKNEGDNIEGTEKKNK